jgi:hypothetical protein
MFKCYNKQDKKFIKSYYLKKLTSSKQFVLSYHYQITTWCNEAYTVLTFFYVDA